ncbi:hypothetical protein EFS28_07400 [Lactobacillus acidophilus]|uniref:hypothetical protein n=1 Tax=Lactobacillus acidophilus TaxID=1579 RepID=UPI0021A6C94A|nr:hypothetical protein [Lactobacillus acidophilus]MCT3603131.1 hypothetical protein [Lactobacillus acidophilus]MCT3624036.1 hypothetical protein [Lactobacillus acidophilus]
MDIKHVQASIADIKAFASMRDYESAHALEDRFYAHVLLSIANGKCKDPAKLASAALKSRKLHFPRWCA